MKPKKDQAKIDRAEIVDDPSKRIELLEKISEEIGQDIQGNLEMKFQLLETELNNATSHDTELKKSDTIDFIKNSFDKIISECELLDKLTSTTKEKLYHIIYNIAQLFFDYVHRMRKFNYSLQGTKYLNWIITQLESNVILSEKKYLKLRVRIYIELAFLYEDLQAYKSAFKVITQAVNKLNDLKAIEEQQIPLPSYANVIFTDNFKYLKYFEFKYGILSGAFTLDVWKKKLDETFPTEEEKLNKFITAINSISNLSWYNSIVNHDASKISWKPQAVAFVYEMMKTDINNIKDGIQQYIERKKRDVELKKKISQNEKNYDDILNEEIAKNAQMNKNYKKSIKKVPIELHSELLKACYDCQMWKEFIELVDSLNIRIQYRSVEVPYVSEVDVQMSSIQYANIPNNYEKIQIDLNVNNYKKAIRSLREAGEHMQQNKQKEPAQQKDNKKGATDKSKKKPAQNEPDEDSNPYEKIEGLEHNFVYLLVRKSHNPAKAITNIRIVMSNDFKIKNELKKNERAIALPIKTFKDNLYEKEENIVSENKKNEDFTANLLNHHTKLIPYLIIKKNETGLVNDKEKMSAIIDIYPLISNSPFADPPVNFTKIDPEISIPGKANDSSYIIYNFNHNYINMCYRNDKPFYVIERESEVLRNLYELENSYNTADTSITPVNKFLSLYYPFDKIDTLAIWLFNSIQGDAGKFFLSERSNYLYDICILLWKKYLKEFLYRIDYFYQIKDELEEKFKKEINDQIEILVPNIFNTLRCIQDVLTRIKDKDVIIYAFISGRLAEYSMRTNNLSIGVIILKKTLDYIEETKENEKIFGMNNPENKHTFTSFTCDNNKIFQLTKDIDDQYDQYVHKLNLKRRINYKEMIREKTKIGINDISRRKMDDDEIKEEDFEVNYIEEEYAKMVNEKEGEGRTYDGKYAYTKDPKNKDSMKINYSVTEYENNLNCVYIDLKIQMYMMYIETGDSILSQYDYSNIPLPKKWANKTQNSSSNNSMNTTSSNVSFNSKHITKPSKNTLKKLDIIQGKTAQHVKESREYLKHSLQDAGKLEPDKPKLSKSEKIMEFEISKNSYLNALFQSCLALKRPNKKQDQIFLLRLSSAYLEKCFNEEEERVKYYKKYFFYIKSMERYNTNKNLNQFSYYPYSLLYKPIMIDAVDKIPEPILINKTSHTCSFIFPIVKIKNDQLDKIYHHITKVAIYGQISTGSNCVQLNNKSLPKTGTIFPIVNYITIPNLKDNEKYIFAYAGYDNEDTIINTIGKTSNEVELYFPLPLYYITYQVCKVAYEFKHYQICKDRAKVVFKNFTERSEVKDTHLDNKANCVHFYKLKYDYIARTSLFELEGVAFCFFYFASSVARLKPDDHSVDYGTNLSSRQKNILKCINVLSLGLEIAIYIRNYFLIKMFLCELYNMSIPFIKAKNLYKELLSVYMKMCLGMSIIPSEVWDMTLRKVSSMVNYNIFIFSNTISEVDVIKKSLILEFGINKKKYYPFIYKFMQKIEEDPKAKKKPEKETKEAKKTPKDAKTENSNQSEGDDKPKFEEIESSSLKDLERECIEIDEYILSCGDYNDLVKTKLGTYITILDKFNKDYGNNYKELQVEIDNRKKDINDLIEVYDGYKAEGLKFIQKFITTSKDKDKYYEYVTKLLKSLIQTFVANISSINQSQYSLSMSVDSKKGGNVSKDNPLGQFPEIIKLVDDIAIKEEDIGFMQNIFKQKLQFLNGDILYTLKVRIHEYLNTIKKEMPNDKANQDIDIGKMAEQIEEKFFGCIVENEILPPYSTLSENDIISLKEKLFWIGELLFNKAVVLYTEFLSIQPNHQSLLNYDFNNFFNYKLCDIKKIRKYGMINTEDDLKLLEVRSGLYIKKEKPKEENTENTEVKNTQQDNKKAAKPPPAKKGKENVIDIIEQIDPFDNHIERQYDIRYAKLDKIFEKLSLGALCMNDVENYSNFDNLLIFAYNIILYDMLTPYDCVNNNIWAYLNIIAEIALNRIVKLEKGISKFTQYDINTELLKIKNRITDTQYNNKPQGFPILPKSTENTITKIDGEKLLNELEKNINLDVYIEFLYFVIQCTFHKQKWSILTNLIQRFNTITNDLFAEFTLSFLIEAQQHIFEKAHEQTMSKQTEINHRNELYENWKKSRKKNKRQQLITGEIPIEQIEYERDYSILSKEFKVLESISNLLRDDQEKSQQLQNSYLNDLNNAMKAVNICRKKYEEYQIEIMSMKKYKYNYNNKYKEYQSKQKAIPHLANNILSSYKSCIQILKKRQENYLLIQILYEMSQIMYTIGDLKNSEVYFNEALDTVFQKLYSIKDFRNIFTIGANATEKYGIRNLCYAICILHKMNKYCYDTDLYNQRECALMSGEVAFNILNNVIPCPQIKVEYGVYRLSEMNMNYNIFKSSENVKANDLLISLLDQCDTLISYGDYEYCIPMLCLSEYIACDVCKNVHFTMKSRIMRISCLSELGYINEAMMMYNKVIKKYDMPTLIGYGYKTYSIGKYANLNSDVFYYNDLPPDDQKNVDAVNNFMKFSIDGELKAMIGGYLYFELLYGKLMILFKLFNKENYASYPEKSNFIEQRSEMFIRIEKESRENIVMLSAYEDISYLNNLLLQIKMYDIDTDSEKKYDSIIKGKIDDCMQKNKILSEELNNFICVKNFKSEMDLSRERYDLIFKYRLLLSKVYSCQGLSLSSSGVLLKAIENFSKLTRSEAKLLNLDNGEDYQFDFKPSEGKDTKGAKGQPAKKEAPKQTGGKKDNKNQPQNPNEPQINPDEELNKILLEISQIVYKNKRFIPNSMYWFKLHYYHLINMYKMGRYKDCSYIIKKFETNSNKVNDVYYYIRSKEIETMVGIQEYDMKKVEKAYNAILDKGKNYIINDWEICYFYSNYAEYLFIEKNYDLAINTLKTARNIIWEKMAKNNYIIPPQSIYDKKVIDNLFIDKTLMNQLKDKESQYSTGGGGKKVEAKGKGAIAGNEIVNIDFFDTENNNNEENYDAPKVEYVQGANLYNRYTEIICKIELKFALFQMQCSKPNVQLIMSILKDLEIMIKKEYFGHSIYGIIIYYIYGLLSKNKFIDNLREFLKVNFYDNIKMLKKNNLDVLTVNKEILFSFSHSYNERCVKIWIPLLKEAKDFLEKSLTLAKTEFLVMESAFNITDITLQLADIYLLLGEYKVISNFKYCNIMQAVTKIQNLIATNKFYDKEDDDLPLLPEENVSDTLKEEKSNFIAAKNKSENIEHINYLKGYLYYSDLTSKIDKIKQNITENLTELATGANLVDASKLPRDIFLQILECDYLTKKKNKDFVQNIAVKPNIDTFDIMNLLKNYVKEIEYFTSNFPTESNVDEMIKNIAKIHKFLKGNLANYSTKCYMEYNIYNIDQNLENYDFVTQDQISINYITMQNEIIPHLSGLNDSQNEKEKKINLVYLLGANSVSGENDNKEVLFGRVLIEENFVMRENKKLYNLKIKVRQSMTFSEEKKQRDFKYYQIDYYNLVFDIIQEILSGKKQFSEIRNVKEVFTNEDIGEVSIEALDFWYNLFNFGFYTANNQKFNALLRKIHIQLINK